MFPFRVGLPLCVMAAVAWSQGGLADSSLEQLRNTQVTSVSRKQEKLSRTAAAIFLINQDDMRDFDQLVGAQAPRSLTGKITWTS